MAESCVLVQGAKTLGQVILLFQPHLYDWSQAGPRVHLTTVFAVAQTLVWKHINFFFPTWGIWFLKLKVNFARNWKLFSQFKGLKKKKKTNNTNEKNTPIVKLCCECACSACVRVSATPSSSLPFISPLSPFHEVSLCGVLSHHTAG